MLIRVFSEIQRQRRIVYLDHKNRIVYADNAATTQPSQEVIAAMNEVLTEHWGNPSSIHPRGNKSKKLIETAREQVAAAINAEPDEIYFTSGGSEANSWALRGTGASNIITSEIEHHSILNCCQYINKRGLWLRIIPAGEDGTVELYELQKYVKQMRSLVSIQTVNNELGTIQPIRAIAEICKRNKSGFHTDAVQAVGNIPVDVKALGVDLLSLSGHKFHAAPGVGALYVRRRIAIAPLIFGGKQESHLRGGTENLAAIVGLGIAAHAAVRKLESKEKRLRPLVNDFIDRVLTIPGSRLNGSRTHRIAGTVNFSFYGIEGQTLVLWLARHRVYASAGSACDSDSVKASHVIKAIGVPKEYELGSIRFSFSDDIDARVISYTFNALYESIIGLRK